MPDAEMIHDQAGIISGREAFIAPIRKNICNGGAQKPIRKRVDQSIEIYPLYDSGRLYGAIQQGQHEFYLREKGKPLVLTNRARFVIVWLKTAEGWKLKSTLSWDHLNPAENGPLDADVLVSGFGHGDEVDYMLAAHKVTAQNVAIVRHGALVGERAAGNASLGRLAGLDTIYNAASLAKPVSALTTLRLVSAGLLKLDEPLSRYYVDPDIAGSPFAAQVTPRMVLSHTSGLPNWRYLDTQNGRGKLRFLSKPGTTYGYSGEGFEWLRKAIERKTGQSWTKLAQKHVFGPAGMTASSFVYPQSLRHRIADRFDSAGKLVRSEPHVKPNAAANFMTTASDYARLLIFLMDGAGLSDQLAKELFSAQTRVSNHKSFALGWELLTSRDGGGYAIQHSGSDPGIRSLAVAWPAKRQAIVILSNSDNAVPTWGLILKEEFGQEGEKVAMANR
jgi:CubicO group peptidase (beta-lactamase class C family)